MKIYISHPYGKRRGLSKEQLEANVAKSIEISRKLISLGHIPFNPLLYHYIDKDWDESCGEDRWHEIGSAWLTDCDAIFLSGEWTKSEGCLTEYDQACALGLKIYKSFFEISWRA